MADTAETFSPTWPSQPFKYVYTSGVEKRADCTDQPLEYSNLIDAANIGETFSTIEF